MSNGNKHFSFTYLSTCFRWWNVYSYLLPIFNWIICLYCTVILYSLDRSLFYSSLHCVVDILITWWCLSEWKFSVFSVLCCFFIYTCIFVLMWLVVVFRYEKLVYSVVQGLYVFTDFSVYSFISYFEVMLNVPDIIVELYISLVLSAFASRILKL